MFGELPGVPEGVGFATRLLLQRAGVHRATRAGISGREGEGAESVVLSGGYEDDRDDGVVVLYTGHGGRAPKTGLQVRDQRLVGGNAALALSCARGLPVRLVRGSRHPSPYAPRFGYRYDGLYRVSSYWKARGRSGFWVWRFRLVKEGAHVADLGDPPPGTVLEPPPAPRMG